MKPQYIKIDEYGNNYYYSDKELKILHREDGPAVEWADGSKEWFINDNRHREDGPAVEGADGTKEWWINGKYLTEAQFNALKAPCAGKVVEIDGKKYKLSLVK